MADAAAAKRLKIKLGVVKRTMKEKSSYEKEIVSQSEKVESMKAEGKDSHDVKQQDEVLKEAKACLVDTDRRLEKAFEDLEETVNEDGGAVGESEDLAAAKTLLEARA